MTKHVKTVLLTLFGSLSLAACQSKSAELPERPPTFDELMVLADKNLAKNSLIQSYIYSQEDGVGFQNVMALAQTGHTKAELMACYLLIDGIGVTEDGNLGYPLCEKAASKGSAVTKINLVYRDIRDERLNMSWQEKYRAFDDLRDETPSHAHRGLQALYRSDQEYPFRPLMYYHLKQAIRHKNTNAMMALSEFDLRIYPKKLRNPKRAEKNLKKAYALYDFDAGHMLALEYREGTSLPQDTETYVSMIQRMANFLHPASMGELGYLHAMGIGVEKDYGKAKELWRQSAKFGNAYSQSMITHDLLFGPEASRDYETGVRYLENRAKNGDVKAMTSLAKHYGRPEIDDPENKRLIWLSNAALLGDLMSQEALGMGMMETGYIEAMQPYIQALEKGVENENLNASYLLARHYRAASGIARDLEKAQLILSRVAHLEDPRVIEEMEIIEGYISHFGGIDAVPKIIENL